MANCSGAGRDQAVGCASRATGSYMVDRSLVEAAKKPYEPIGKAVGYGLMILGAGAALFGGAGNRRREE